MRRSILFAAVLALLTYSRAVDAQREEELLYDPNDNTTGLVFGVRGLFVPALSASGEEQFEDIEVETTWGSGLGVLLGYGFSPNLMFFATVDQSAHDPDNAQIAGGITLYHFDFGARYHLRMSDPRYMPYVSLALGGKQLYTRRFNDPNDGILKRATINALAIVPGGGFQMFVTEHFALDASASVSIGSFRRISVAGSRQRMESSGGVTTRISFGVNWYPET